MNVKLPAAISECIRAINASDVEAIVSIFAADAYVNDNRREIVGLAAIRGWLMKEIIGARVTVQVRRVREHYGQFIVDAVYDGTFDKTNLPSQLVLTNYFRVVDDKIVHLTILFNQPAPY